MEPLLNEQDLQSIDLALVAIVDVEENVARAELAGLDMTRQKMQINETKQRLTLVKQAFFPGR